MFTSDSSETASSGTNARHEAAVVTAAAVIRNWRRVGTHSAGNMGNSVSCGLGSELSEAILAQERFVRGEFLPRPSSFPSCLYQRDRKTAIPDDNSCRAETFQHSSSERPPQSIAGDWLPPNQGRFSAAVRHGRERGRS